MDDQTVYQEPWEGFSPQTSGPQMSGPQGPGPRGPEDPVDKGNVPLGIVGALLGACVGAIPWFLVSTFTSFYVGWLGFLVGWASAFGYQKLKGRRSFGFAMAVMVISSLLALVVAEYGSWMFMLCTDPEWQADAAWYGIPVAQLAFESLLMPENFEHILPGLAMGLVIGGLGILSAGKYVRQYTDPEKAVEIAQRAQLIRDPLNSFQPTGLELPQQFTVGMSKGRKVAVTIMSVMVFLLLAFLLLVTGVLAAEGEPEGLVLILILALVLGGIMVFAMTTVRRHIDVDGDRLLVKGREIWARDIANVSMSQLNGAIKLYGHDNKVLAQFNGAMNNAPLMIQWLKEHDIPLRG